MLAENCSKEWHLGSIPVSNSQWTLCTSPSVIWKPNKENAFSVSPFIYANMWRLLHLIGVLTGTLCFGQINLRTTLLESSTNVCMNGPTQINIWKKCSCLLLSTVERIPEYPENAVSAYGIINTSIIVTDWARTYRILRYSSQTGNLRLLGNCKSCFSSKIWTC